MTGATLTTPEPLPVQVDGDYIGEMSLIDNEAHSATVRAEVQTDMLALGRAEFARCLPENSSMAYAIMKGLVQRLRQAMETIDRQAEKLKESASNPLTAA